MSGSRSSLLGKPFGLARVCRVGRMSRATLSRQRGAGLDRPPPKRPGAIGPCSDADLVEQIRAEIAAAAFHREGYRKIWARLRFAGIRSSQPRIRRLMKEHALPAPHRARPPRQRSHEGPITTPAVDPMGGTDMTQAVTVDQGRAFVFATVDHGRGEIVGIHAARRGTRFEALEPLRQGVRRCFGAFGKDVACGLALRHDHGSNDLAHDVQAEIAFLGIARSPCFVRPPEGHGVAERFLRTLTETVLWVHSFNTMEELRLALLAFARRDTATWLVARPATNHPIRSAPSKRPLIKPPDQPYPWPPDKHARCLKIRAHYSPAVYGWMRHLMSGRSREEVDMTEIIKEAPGLGRGGRMSRQRMLTAVLRLLRGEDLEWVSRELGVTAATLSSWRDDVLAGREAALARRPKDGRDLETDQLKAKLGEVLLERELLQRNIELLESARPLARRRSRP
jgi:putative transposase